jgi:hypothetical protein
MKGIFQIIWKHKKHVEPIYNDYEQDPEMLKPSQLLRPEFQGSFTEDSYDKWALHHKKGIYRLTGY